MPRVSFGSRVVQKLKRVSLNHNLLENIQVKEGDTIDLPPSPLPIHSCRRGALCATGLCHRALVL